VGSSMAIDQRQKLRTVQRIIAYSLIPLAILIFFSGKFRTDPEGIRELVRERLRDHFPGSTISETIAEFEIIEPDGQRRVLDFAAIEKRCADKPRSCAGAVDDSLIALIEGRKPPAARPGGASSSGVPR
ncbi:MAG: hypothetical protein ABIU95_11360, partial [Burkholderiales bacterium]